MPIRPAISRTAGPLPSFVPVTSKKGSTFVFWDAVQLSNAIYGFWGFAFERSLGEGAQFKVDLYRNPDKDSDMPELVAVKTAKIDTPFMPDDPDGDGIHRRTNDLYSFVQEMQVLSHPPLQSHPNIMTLLGSSWTVDAFGTQIPQLIVEYSPLGNLFDMLATSPPLTIQDKLNIVFDIASGLERIHDCAIAHGDMKLSNIMVFPSERPDCRFTAKISDFGSSIAADDPDERKTYWGSPGYCPPDALTEATLSLEDLQSCDVFGLGLCAWEILNDGRPFFEQDQERIPTGRHVPTTYPFLVRVDAFLNSMPLLHTQGPMRDGVLLGLETAPDVTEVSVLEPLKALLHGLLDPIRSLRWTSKQVVRYMVNNFRLTPRLSGPSSKTTPGTVHTSNIIFRRPSVGIFTASQNQIPRDAQRQSVKDLQEFWPSLDGADKCQALVILSDCFAHGYGTPVNFRECLRYLQLAAENRESGAVDVVLLPVSAAILGETEQSLLQSSDIKRALRPALASFEEDLCLHPHHERYYRRWLHWLDMTNEILVGSPFTIEDSNGSIHVLDLDDTLKRDSCILEDIKDPLRAIARQQNTDATPSAMPLLQFAAAMDWKDILKKMHARDASMLHHVYQGDDFPPEVANFGSILFAALAHGRSGLVRFLVEEVGVSVKVQPDCAGLPAYIEPLHLALNLPDEDLRDTVNLLIDHGVDVNLKNLAGISLSSLPGHFPLEITGPPLDVAIFIGRLDLVRILLERGANPLLECEGTIFKRPHTPLQLAVALHVHEIVDAILAHLETTIGGNNPLLRKHNTGTLMLHLSGLILGGKGLFWQWLLHGSRYIEACRRTIQVCVKHGLDINRTVDEDGDTPLIHAAAQNPCHAYVLEAILDHGANPNIQNKFGSFALSLCLNLAWGSADYSRCVKALLAAGANVHLAIPNGRQPIHLHAEADMKESVNLLLDAGADIESRDNQDATPLVIAVRNDAYACAETLLDRGAKINALIHPRPFPEPMTALNFAAKMGNLRMFRLLTKRGALPCPPLPPNSGTAPASSALHHAADAGRAEVLRVAFREFPAIHRTPELLSQSSITGYTVLHHAARAHLGCVRELLLAGTPLEARDTRQALGFGSTPLGVSVQGGAFDISRFLLQNGAWPWVRGPREGRWWSFLCEGLVKARMEPKGEGGMAELLQQTWEWVVEWDLLRARDFGGRTALHMAVYLGRVEVVKMLVERGASVYDRVGEPMEHVPWNSENFLSGMNCWEFARVLRRLSPEQRGGLFDPATAPIPDEDMEEVVGYLRGFEWPVTVSGGETDSKDGPQRDSVSESGGDLGRVDTSGGDREREEVDANKDHAEAEDGAPNIETLGRMVESLEVVEVDHS